MVKPGSEPFPWLPELLTDPTDKLFQLFLPLPTASRLLLYREEGGRANGLLAGRPHQPLSRSRPVLLTGAQAAVSAVQVTNRSLEGSSLVEGKSIDL